MKTKEKDINNGWKVLIVLTFIISLIVLIIILQDHKPIYQYETKLIKLNDSNFLDRIEVVEYTCDENVKVTNIRSAWYFKNKMFYASTWEDGKVPHSYGECFIKIRK